MKIDVKHVSKLANLTIEEGEEEKFERQLSEVLDHISKLNEVDTSKVETTSQVTGLENVTREDVPKQSISQEEALSSSSAKHNGFFQVKGIFENE